jgi:hypothetical protein
MNENFLISEVIDLNENNSFSLVNDKMENEAMCIINDRNITIYFEDGRKKEFNSNYDLMLEYVDEIGLKFIKLMNGNHRWKKYNPNPLNKNVRDCTFRAYCAAFNIEWDEAFDTAVKFAKELKQLPNEGKVMDLVIESYGGIIDEEYKNKKRSERLTVNQFAMTHPYGIYILRVRGHMVTVKNGEYYDTWDSGDKKVSKVHIIKQK